MIKQTVFVTIGEAPRTDLQKTFDRYFKGEERVRQDGLLNGLSKEEAEHCLGADGSSSATLTSRFVTGEAIVMDAAKVERALQHKITFLEKNGADLIVILCTGTFEQLKTENARLVEAEKITVPFVKEKSGNRKIGVMVPLEEQMEETAAKWVLGDQGAFAFASPYAFTEQGFQTAAKKLAATGSETIVLDCMGYSDEMKRFVEQATKGPEVIQSNEVLFQYVTQLLG